MVVSDERGVQHWAPHGRRRYRWASVRLTGRRGRSAAAGLASFYGQAGPQIEVGIATIKD